MLKTEAEERIEAIEQEIKAKEAEQKFRTIKEQEEKKKLLSPPTTEDKIEKLKKANNQLKVHIPENVLEIIEAEIKASRGEQDLKESKDNKDGKNN